MAHVLREDVGAKNGCGWDECVGQRAAASAPGRVCVSWPSRSSHRQQVIPREPKGAGAAACCCPSLPALPLPDPGQTVSPGACQGGTQPQLPCPVPARRAPLLPALAGTRWPSPGGRRTSPPAPASTTRTTPGRPPSPLPTSSTTRPSPTR